MCGACRQPLQLQALAVLELCIHISSVADDMQWVCLMPGGCAHQWGMWSVMQEEDEAEVDAASDDAQGLLYHFLPADIPSRPTDTQLADSAVQVAQVRCPSFCACTANHNSSLDVAGMLACALCQCRIPNAVMME